MQEKIEPMKPCCCKWNNWCHVAQRLLLAMYVFCFDTPGNYQILLLQKTHWYRLGTPLGNRHPVGGADNFGHRLRDISRGENGRVRLNHDIPIS